ncbi:MAG: hypothetical protein P4L56_06640 [Candidatus Sulfopaludibacter sp.]|nr:hypothetical protein [Candidatus Sulfopaludibacter sp.]
MQIQISSLFSETGRFRRSLFALLRLSRVPARGGWNAAIDGVIAGLENLNRSTEQDFLAVGEKLMEFRGCARRIASDIAVLAGLTTGEHGRNAAQALECVLEHSRALRVRVEATGEALENVRALARRLRQTFSGLSHAVSTFRTLCTLTRIETSRLGATSAGFADLAEEVRPLSESIQASGESVVAAAATLDQGVETALRNALGLREKQLREVPELIATVMEGLRAFTAQQQQAAEATVRQAAQYEELCAAVDGLVRSIQFHDITRQQIEHVMDALRPAPGGALPGRSLVALQSSQLHSAARVFASAVEGIERDLDAVASRLESMAKASLSLTGGSDRERDSFFVRMEGCFSAVLQAVAACASEQAEMPRTVRTIEDLAGRMRGSIADIGGVEIRIQRIAINATIRSAHIGAGGDPLGVIAGVMQKMVADSGAKTQEAETALAAIGDAGRRLALGEDPRSDAAEACQPLQRAILEMHSASETGSVLVRQIVETGARLAVDIHALRNGFTVGPLVAGVLQRACGELDRIAAGLPAEQDGGPGLEELAGRYTMQMERDIHELALRGKSAEAVTDEALGDNVELF